MHLWKSRSYACLEIMGNHDRNQWKSGNVASHQKSQYLTEFFKAHVKSYKYKLIHVRSLNIATYKYHIISLIIDDLRICNSIISRVGFVFKT